MSKTYEPEWQLDENWAVGADPYNWILYRRSGKQWRPRSYHPTAEQLLRSFHRKLVRTEHANPDLVQHLESLSERAQAAADAFHETLTAGGRVWPHYREFQRKDWPEQEVTQKATSVAPRLLNEADCK